jgi:hypothetical protein
MKSKEINSKCIFHQRAPTEGGSGGVATPQGGGAGATPPLTGFDLPGQVAGVRGQRPPQALSKTVRPSEDKMRSNDLRGIGSSDLMVAT